MYIFHIGGQRGGARIRQGKTVDSFLEFPWLLKTAETFHPVARASPPESSSTTGLFHVLICFPGPKDCDAQAGA